jgi:hypothetical protein
MDQTDTEHKLIKYGTRSMNDGLLTIEAHTQNLYNLLVLYVIPHAI